MSYELRGKLTKIFDTQTFNSGFTKREFVVTTEEQYPQDIKFELIKDKTSMIEQYNVGDVLNVKFDIRGSEWNGKYFVNLNAWRVDPAAAGAGAAAPQEAAASGQSTPPPPAAPAPTDIDLGSAEEDDLPF
ncbi:MAG: DUF3127 domain-containing protein [Flavobacteriales bacterium]|uniref:DUF3127 domain-containing protein n=1 Tax=Sanyastnella coralliicola TaxID=3069118 RepID=UPI0027B8E7DD|nr:DUF3127 domain-containing protein [Longitalea sp. SCSIO 12813]MCH2200046.1 DUF3127 domain-containing protein [Flavobacteriales bacterium]